MGYACPVCDVPQQDAEHLANHLAFTAMLHESDHADWLDESVPEWREDGPAELAPRVADLAGESDYDAVFEDTTDQGHQHDHGDHQHGGVDPAAAAQRGAAGDLDSETQSVLQEARAMTREMLDDAEEEGTETDDADEGRTEPTGEDEDGNS